MSSPKNLQRDCVWTDPSLALTAWPTIFDRLNSDGTVYQDVGTCIVSSSASSPLVKAGVMIQQPVGESTPYRVKVRGKSQGGSWLDCGYATTQTGTNDTTGDSNRIAGFDTEIDYDEVVIVAGANEANPLYFALIAGSSATVYDVHISVQRLNVVAPMFQTAVA